MATKNPRINVTFEAKTAGLLSQLAYQEHKSVASLVRELALEALELREDFYLSKIAEKLDKEGVKTYGHDEAWK
jgi:predicted DNA-binding protein